MSVIRSMDEMVVELESREAALRLSERLAAVGYTARITDATHVWVAAPARARAFSALLHEISDWFAREAGGGGVVRFDGRSYVIEAREEAGGAVSWAGSPTRAQA